MNNCSYCKLSGQTRNLPVSEDIVNRCLKHRNCACFACQKLTNLERRIEDARRALECLFDEKEELLSALNDQHDPFASRLPVEIVSRIFVHGLPVPLSIGTIHEGYSRQETFSAVFIPGHVCRNWRNIAERTPQLWTIVCMAITNDNCVLSALVAYQWLKRSGGLPLFVQLTIEETYSSAASTAVEKVISQLALHAQRWEVLDIDTPPDFLPWFSAALSTERLDNLEHLKLSVYTTNPNIEPLKLSATPCRLTLRTGCFDRISMDFVKLGKLTHFDGCTISYQEIKLLFRDAPCLMTCSISDADFLDANDTADGPLEHPSLQNLTIGCVNENFWDIFTFGSLETLHLNQPIHRHSAECWNTFRSFICRSGCKVKEVTIEDHNEDCICKNQLVDILKLTPHLQQLSVKGAYFQDQFFSAMDKAATLTPAQPAPNFLNNLETLNYTTYNIGFNWPTLLGFLTAMTVGQGRSLRAFSFRHKEYFPSDEDYDTLLKEPSFKLTLDAVQGLEFEMLDGQGRDLVERWRHLQS